MKNKIYLLSILFVFIVCFYQGTTSHAATEVAAGSCGDNITWKLTKDGVLRISGEGEMKQGEFLPEPYEGIPKKVVIDHGVTSIKFRAFPYDSIKEISIPDSVVSIESGAFQDCGIEKIMIPDSVEMIGENAFEGCSELKEIHLPGKLKVIRGRIFSGCVNLRNLVIPDSVEKIEPLAFYRAYGLTKVTIGKGVKEIGNNIFLEADRVREINNLSAVSFDITQTGTKTDQVSWFVNAVQTKSIPPFSVAIGRGRKYKLSYQLNGAKVKGKLPRSYRYGDIVEFPRNVTKKGYIFSGWNIISRKRYLAGKRCMGLEDCKLDSLYDTHGDRIMIPRFYKVKIKRKNRSSALVTVDLSELGTSYFGTILVCYSEAGKDKKYKVIYREEDKHKKVKIVMKNLKRGKKYRVKFLLTDSSRYDMDSAKKAVGVLKFDGRKVYCHR